jgi:gliding motility-associated-like protein
MKSKSAAIILTFFLAQFASAKKDLPQINSSSQQISFTENKGQVSDQFYKPRPDVLFSGAAGDLVFHLKQTGISYQMTRVDKWKEPDTNSVFMNKKMSGDKVPEEVTIYRLDIDWLNANKNAAVEKENATEGYNNYYLESCPYGALGVKSYKQIIYKKLYTGIDLKWYEKGGNLKYDYIVAPNADYKQIQLKLNGAEKISVSDKGELIIKTPLGEITEQAPFVLQNGKQLKAKWKLDRDASTSLSGTIISFDIENVNSSLPMTIDPLVRLWGTYYGGNNKDDGWFVYTDPTDNVYLTGQSKSNISIATTGAQQTTYAGGGTYWGDAYIVKFNPVGVRLWGTYYGGSGPDFACECITDTGGNIFCVGGASTTNSAVIATPGAHQTTPTGGFFGDGTNDAFLVKFNSAGVRQWGTFYGGTGCEWAEGIDLDNSGNIYITGGTTSSSAIVTTGCHQSSIGVYFDAFLVKFDGAGTRQWATYYGGNAYDNGECCKVDAFGNVFLKGYTMSNNSAVISTAGSHQQMYGGGGDGYLVKFNNSGVRQWATYYGGSGDDYFGHFKIDSSGDLYLPGGSGSSTGTVIATPGTHQPNYGGGASDSYIVKFGSVGNRIWATYYGGTGDDYCYNLTLDQSGNIYISGCTSTSSGTSIATPCTYQFIYGGGTYDTYLAKFTSAGVRIWGTYYGGAGQEGLVPGASTWFWVDNTVDSQGNIFLCGPTSSSTGTAIASPSSHQPIYGGGTTDGFLVKFDGCKPPSNTTSPPNQIICQGKSTTLTSTLGCGITWFDAIGGSPIGTGSMISVSPVNTTTFYIDDISCGLSNSPTAVSVTVNPTPTLSIASDRTLVCSGANVNLNGSGANTYTWMPQSSNLTSLNFSPTASITQSLIGSNGTCTNNAQVQILVIQYPVLSVNYDNTAHCYIAVVNFTASGAQNYSWSPIDQLTSSSGTLVSSIPLFQNTYYSITGSNSSGTVVCANQKTFSVTVIPPIDSKISDSTSICEGDRVDLAIYGGNTYHWSPSWHFLDPTQPFATVYPHTSTIYSVAVSVNEFCPITRTVYVNVFPKPELNAGVDTIINIGDHYVLNPTGEGSFRWLTGENMTCADCKNPETLPFTKTCYLVELTDLHHCKAQDEVCVEIVNDYGCYIPNTFTPNDDGKNEFFLPKYYGIREIRLTIFDRWGQQLFYTQDQNAQWDGTFLGKPCKEDVYVFKLEYDPYRGKHGDKVGNVNLIR